MPPPILLREMTAADLEFADCLRDLAGWNQTVGDWKRLLDLSPDGCFVATRDGASVGTATTLFYNDQLVWIGMLLVHPWFRRSGIGRALLEHCLSHLDSRGIVCIKLDATAQGKQLYERAGFKEELSITRWEIARLPDLVREESSGIRPAKESDAPLIQELDETAFGVARPNLLKSLLKESCLALVHES